MHPVTSGQQGGKDSATGKRGICTATADGVHFEDTHLLSLEHVSCPFGWGRRRSAAGRDARQVIADFFLDRDEGPLTLPEPL
jgi:hypothetical protein